MFATIKTNGASHIVIHIPHDGSDKSLPALVRMLEQNATFINCGYLDTNIVKPTMSIILGDVFKVDSQESELIIKESSAVIGDDFQNWTPEIRTSNAVALKRETDASSKLRIELSFVKSQLEQAKAQITALTDLTQE